jgi:hypothetical protein
MARELETPGTGFNPAFQKICEIKSSGIETSEGDAMEHPQARTNVCVAAGDARPVTRFTRPRTACRRRGYFVAEKLYSP